MTDIDALGLQAALGRPIALFDGQVGVASATDRSGFDAFAAMILQARAHLSQGAGTLTLLIEHSDDGASWSTAHEFLFSASDDATVEVSSPKSYVRCRESASGGLWTPVSVQAIPAALNEPGGNGGSSPFLTASIAVTSAEIKAVASSPKLLIAAPGANKFLNVVSGVYFYKFGTTPYTSADGFDGIYGTDPNGQPVLILQSIDGVMASSIQTNVGNVGSPSADLLNKAIYLVGLGADPTVGDGTFTLVVYYTVETLT